MRVTIRVFWSEHSGAGVLSSLTGLKVTMLVPGHSHDT